MKTSNGDLPAMPVDMTNEKLLKMMQESTVSSSAKIAVKAMLGISKREMFAMAAMQGLLAFHGDDEYNSGLIAKYSVEKADALLAELEKAK